MSYPQFKALVGHTSPETAYVVADYPYSWQLRCKIRYWIEYKAKFGYRLMSQTTNPKRPGEVWNTPKASTYSFLLWMYLDEQDHVATAALGPNDDDDRINAVRLLVGDEALAPSMPLIRASRILRDRTANAWRLRYPEDGKPQLPIPPPPLPTWDALVALQGPRLQLYSNGAVTLDVALDQSARDRVRALGAVFLQTAENGDEHWSLPTRRQENT